MQWIAGREANVKTGHPGPEWMANAGGRKAGRSFTFRLAGTVK